MNQTIKQQVYELIEKLPENELFTAQRFLEFLIAYPQWPSLAKAPFDDEPETDEEHEIAAKARCSPRERDLDQDEFRRELGL